ncbi:hypothetical protein Aperf_G00000004583 [Anoplocephala perfoliata]
MRENLKDKNVTPNSVLATFRKAVTFRSVWTDKDEFLDVIYWMRQIVGLITGVLLGLIPIKGAYGIALFFAINCCVVYFYSSTFQTVDEEDYGGYGEILKEGLMTCFATFLVVWIVIYDTLYGTKLWKTISRSRDIKTSALRGVTDGSKCWITVTSVGDSLLSISSDVKIESSTPQKLCFRIGQAPDQSQNLRGVIEKSLLALGENSSTILEVFPDDCSSVKLTIHLDAFSVPQTFNPTPADDEEEEKNQSTLNKNENSEENPDNANNLAWRASISRLWFARAEALKSRGSFFFNASHVTEAFACYCRALQLVSLLSANFGLFARAEEEETEREHCEEHFGTVNDAEYVDLDVESPFPVDPDQIELSAALIEKMHFSLLSNMALCQLKAGSPSAALKLCSKALEMTPKNKELTSPDLEEVDEARITPKDVEKVLYRRATALFQMEEFEAGLLDTGRLLELDPTNAAGEKLSKELQVALRTHNLTMAKMMKKAFQ